MNRSELENKSLHELRTIGRKIGVKSVTTLRKKLLINAILDVSNGKIEPYFSTRGRPAYSSDIKNNSRNKQISQNDLKKINMELKNLKKLIIELLTK